MKLRTEKTLSSIPASIVRRLLRANWLVKLAIGGVFLFAAVGVVAVEVTGTTGFCRSCHIMHPYYDSWTTSGHAEVNCLKCHLQPGFTGYIKGKINGLAQAVDCAVGRVGTKPSATVSDRSCLRSDCHSLAELRAEMLEYGGVAEAACKTVVRQRMCISGSRWKDGGASCVLALRTLKLTTGRWQQFWSYIIRHGPTLY